MIRLGGAVTRDGHHAAPHRVSAGPLIGNGGMCGVFPEAVRTPLRFVRAARSSGCRRFQHQRAPGARNAEAICYQTAWWTPWKRTPVFTCRC